MSEAEVERLHHSTATLLRVLREERAKEDPMTIRIPSAFRIAPSRKPRITIAADGRVGWPGIVQYEVCERIHRTTGVVATLAEFLAFLALRLARPSQVYETRPTGRLVAVPPVDGTAYRVRVHDAPAHQALEAAGWLSGTAHLGPREPLVDQRKT